MEVKFAIYDSVTGLVLRKGSSSNERAAMIGLQDGQAIYFGDVNPATQYLPGGEVEERALPPVVITVEQVKEHAARLLRDTDWYVIRALDTDGGAPVPDEIKAYRREVRLRSGEIELMDPIPSNYRDAGMWPDAISSTME